jgi:formiminoglutamase
LSIDLSVVRRADLPASGQSVAFGVSADELARLCWYAGHSPRLQSVGFYGYDATKDTDGQAAHTVATTIWYLAEALGQRETTTDFHSSQYQQIAVPLPGDMTLLFYKHNLADHWWLQVPYSLSGQSDLHIYLPCTYDDYLVAVDGEIPDCWIKSLNRLTEFAKFK